MICCKTIKKQKKEKDLTDVPRAHHIRKVGCSSGISTKNFIIRSLQMTVQHKRKEMYIFVCYVLNHALVLCLINIDPIYSNRKKIK